MTPEQGQAIASVCLFAAFADGGQSDAERAKIRDVIEGWGIPGFTEATRRVLLKETTLEAQAALLTTEELRSLAWEAALTVCDSDGATSPAERAFLDSLATSLRRPLDLAHRDIEQANQLATPALPAPVATTQAPPHPPSDIRHPASAPDPRLAEADSSILKYAITTAAIELLPDGISTIAIIPLQTKMVHGIGSTFGYSLSASSIKELLATVGVGVTGQVLEGYARKLLGKLGGSLLGGMGKTAANWGTGPIMTFATTYAMGQVAKQYYAGGRTLSAISLKALFSQQTEQAKSLYSRYEPQIRHTAANTSPSQLLGSRSR
jgi:uncharacterized protein (DUF697 family)/tellurite resistance protein